MPFSRKFNPQMKTVTSSSKSNSSFKKNPKKMVSLVKLGTFGLILIIAPMAIGQPEYYLKAARLYYDAANKSTIPADKACYTQFGRYHECLAQPNGSCNKPTCEIQGEGSAAGANTGAANTVGTDPNISNAANMLAKLFSGGTSSPGLDNGETSVERESSTYRSRPRQNARNANNGPDPSTAVNKSKQLINAHFNEAAEDMANSLLIQGGHTVIDYNNRQPNGEPTVTVYPSGPIPREISFPEPEIDMAPPLRRTAPEVQTGVASSVTESPAIDAIVGNVTTPLPDSFTPNSGLFTTPPGYYDKPIVTLEMQLRQQLDAMPEEEGPSLMTRINPFYYVGKAGEAAGEWTGQQWIQFKKGIERSRDEWFPFAKDDLLEDKQ